MTYQPGGAIVTNKQPSFDAFSRFRVSNPKTLHTGKQLLDKQPLIFDEIVNGTATSTWSNSSVVMTTSASGDYVIRQSKQRFNYQAGKSQNIKFTFDNLTPQTNIIKRVGYFSSTTVAPYNSGFDGLYMSTDGTTVYVNEAKGGTVTSVAQSSWNIDKLDGTGPSGVTVDRSKTQLIVLDFAWLAVGSVRWAIYINSQLYYFHYFDHFNAIDGVYMLSPNQPIRYEIRQTGAGSGTFTHICSEVESEGGQEFLGSVRAESFENVNLASASTSYVVKSIRLGSTTLLATVDVSGLSCVSTGNDNYAVEIILNPTITGVLTYSAVTNSSVEQATGNGTQTVTGGTKIYSSYKLQTTTAEAILESAVKIGVSINGVSDQLVMIVRPLSNNATVSGSIIWKETI